MKRIKVIDSHTGGEPTRVVVSGGPDLGSGTMAERAVVFRERFDSFRTATVNEPRGNDAPSGWWSRWPTWGACSRENCSAWRLLWATWKPG